MNNILITGATGFIGSWLTRFFIDKDCHIVAHGSSKKSVDRLQKTLLDNNIALANVSFWVQDFMKEQWTFPDFSAVDYVIHCAALTSVRNSTRENLNRYFTVNVLGTKRLAAHTTDYDIDHFIHFSSGQVYGKPNSYPITDSTSKEPINMYGFTKLMSEQVVESFGTFGLPFTIFRPFSVYGPEQSNVISIFSQKIRNKEPLTIFGDGTQKRAFTHVKDICNAIGVLLSNQDAVGREFNLSGPEEFSINELVTLLGEYFGSSPEIVYKASKVEELKRNLADTQPLKELGFQYKYGLEEFIKKM